MVSPKPFSILLVALVAAVSATPFVSRQETPSPPSDEASSLTCANVRCAGDTRCVMIDGRPRCIPRADRGEPCGDVICPLATKCCNPLRSICIKPGVMCVMGGEDEGEV